MDDIGLPKTPPRPQAPVAKAPSVIGKKVRSGLLPVMSLRDYEPVGLRRTVQRLDTPAQQEPKFLPPLVFGREAGRDPNMLPSATRRQQF